MNRPIKILTLALTLVSSGFLANIALAADALEEIVVTAQKRSESAQTVPIAITALSSQDLENAGVDSITDLTMVAPGLQLERTAIFSTPYIRGVGSNATGPGNDPSVATYLDGVYLSSKSANLFDLYNIEHIEVLKGPQGTLFGRNATGGAINIVTRSPTDNLEAQAELTYGNYATTIFKGYVAGPLTDVLKASVAVMARDGGNFVRGLYYDRESGGDKAQSIMAKLVFEPIDKLQIVGAVDYTSSNDTEGIAGGIVPGSVPLSALLGGATSTAVDEDAAGSPPRNDLVNRGVSLHVKYTTPVADLISISAYRYAQSQITFDNDRTNANIFLFDDFEYMKTFSQEFQVISNGSGPFKWMFGANYMNDRQGYTPLNLYVGVPFPADVQQVQAAMFESPNNALISINAATQDKAAAVFTQETYEITKGTRVTGGLRFTQEKKSFTGNEAADVPNGLTVVPPDPAASDSFVPVTVAAAPTVEKTFNKPTWRFSVDQDFSDSLLGYVSYNRGFKSGAYNPTAIVPNSIPVNPEVLDAYEIGVKSELLEHRLRVNAAAFHYNYKDLQVQTVNGTTGGVTTQNAAKAVSNGGELEVSALVTDGFTLNAGVSVLHAKYEDYLNASVFIPCVTAPTTPGCVGPAGNAQGFRNASGDNMLFAPKFTANLGAEYRAQLPGDNSLKFSSQYYHNSGYDTEVGGRLHVPSYNLLNMAATFYTPHDHYFLRLWGENLTDSHHAAYLNGGTQADGIAYYRPITYGITVGGKL